jgi:hypothetical protein
MTYDSFGGLLASSEALSIDFGDLSGFNSSIIASSMVDYLVISSFGIS